MPAHSQVPSHFRNDRDPHHEPASRQLPVVRKMICDAFLIDVFLIYEWL